MKDCLKCLFCHNCAVCHSNFLNNYLIHNNFSLIEPRERRWEASPGEEIAKPQTGSYHHNG